MGWLWANRLSNWSHTISIRSVRGWSFFPRGWIPAWMQNPTKDFQGKQWPLWPERGRGAMLRSRTRVPGELLRVTELQKKTGGPERSGIYRFCLWLLKRDDEKPCVVFINLRRILSGLQNTDSAEKHVLYVFDIKPPTTFQLQLCINTFHCTNWLVVST